MSAVVLCSAAVLCTALWFWGRVGTLWPSQGSDCVRQVSNRSEKVFERSKVCGTWRRPHFAPSEQPFLVSYKTLAISRGPGSKLAKGPAAYDSRVARQLVFKFLLRCEPCANL